MGANYRLMQFLGRVAEELSRHPTPGQRDPRMEALDAMFRTTLIARSTSVSVYVIRAHKAHWSMTLSTIVWWVESGRHVYRLHGPRGDRDDALRGLVVAAVMTVGGWRAARALVRGMALISQYQPPAPEAKPERGILVRRRS